MESTFIVKTKKREFKAKIKFELLDGEYRADIGYGFLSHFTETNEKVLGGIGCYRLHHSIQPAQIESITHEKTKRIFTFGKEQGFIRYSCPLLENGVKKATVYYEDYYKD